MVGMHVDDQSTCAREMASWQCWTLRVPHAVFIIVGARVLSIAAIQRVEGWDSLFKLDGLGTTCLCSCNPFQLEALRMRVLRLRRSIVSLTWSMD